MNLTTHIFHEGTSAGRIVLNPVPNELITLQGEVRQAFGWSLDADDSSAMEMEKCFSEKHPFGQEAWSIESRKAALLSLKQSICSAERLVIIGAGSESIQTHQYPGAKFVAADGAVGAIDDLSRVLCVVSDGDGAEHLERAARHGIHIVLHAHGDNADIWKHLASKWANFDSPPPLTLTYQSMKQYDGMYNPGGFTDGDRALCLIRALGRSLDVVECIGFRTDYVGPWSGTTDPLRKKQKLRWMEESMRRLGVEHHLIN